MARRDDLDTNDEFWSDIENLSLKKQFLMGKWGCSSSFIADRRSGLRKRAGDSASGGPLTESVYTPGVYSRSVKGESETHNADGSSDYVRKSDEPWGEDDFRDFLRQRGTDPDTVTFTWGWTTNPAGGVWNKLNNVRKKGEGKGESATLDPEVVFEAARNFHYVPFRAGIRPPRSLVILATDLQTGKTDRAGNHVETINQCLQSFARAAEFVKENPVQEIVIVDAGDIVENTFNTPEQIATNSLDLPHQIVEAAYVMQRGIQMLAPLAPSIRYAAVSSNHGQYRTGFKQAGGNAHADFGIAIAKLLQNAFELNPQAYSHITVQTPEPYMESLSFETSGTKIGVVHGHQSSSADKMGDWWKGQSHGRLPTADADHLLVGHWHSARVQQSGDARWIFIGSASDRGSSWFTNLKGEQSKSGMLTYTTADGDWADLRIL